ncbi:MAG: M48 family metalloprotease [Pseudomonadota bacterium]
MKRHLTCIMIAALLSIPASAPAFDLGQVVQSAVGGIQQVAEASKDITPSEEHYIGRAVAAEVLSKYPLFDNPALTKYINEVGLLLAYSSERPSTYGGYHFAVLASQEPNAFACPGGIIFINQGLLKLLKNEDQLAAILGHEIMHVVQRHSIGELKKAQWTKLGFYAAAEVGKQYSASEVGQIVNQFQGVVSDVAKRVLESGYSKGDEKKADESGMRLAYKVGYNPSEGVDFFKMLEEKDIGTSSGPFADHPKIQARIKNLEGELGGLNDAAATDPVRTARFNAVMGRR